MNEIDMRRLKELETIKYELKQAARNLRKNAWEEYRGGVNDLADHLIGIIDGRISRITQEDK